MWLLQNRQSPTWLTLYFYWSSLFYANDDSRWQYVCVQSLHLPLPMKRAWGDRGEAQWCLSYTETSQAESGGHFLLLDFKNANTSGVLVPARGPEVPAVGTKGCGDQRPGSEPTSPGCEDSAIYAPGLGISPVRCRWQVSSQDDACTQRHLSKSCEPGLESRSGRWVLGNFALSFPTDWLIR